MTSPEGSGTLKTMMGPTSALRQVLSGLLTVSLTVPLAIAQHHHAAEHDGRTVHLELPHGAHHSPAPELYERVTSAGPSTPAALRPVMVPTMEEVVVAMADLQATRLEHPARPPPTPLRSRPPPIGS